MRAAKLSLIALSAGACLGLSSGVSAMAPPPCTPPTAEDCQNSLYVESACGEIDRAACLTYYEPLWDSAPGGEVLPWPELLVDDMTTAWGQPEAVEGKRAPFDRASLVAGTSSDTSLSTPTPGYSTLAPLAAWTLAPAAGLSPAATAITAVKYPAYETAAIVDCRDYVYKKFYGYERFEHAASRCVDAECVYQVAYHDDPGTPQPEAPGIASRLLTRRDGIVMTPQIAPAHDRRQKNPFFAVPIDAIKKTTQYLYADPWTRSVYDVILGHISANRNYYDIGMPGPIDDDRRFGDVWAFHQVMHYRTHDVTRAEKINNAKRLAKITRLSQELAFQLLIDRLGADRVVPFMDDLRTIVAPGPSDGPDFTAPSPGDPFELTRALGVVFDGVSTGSIPVRGEWYRWVSLHPTDLPAESLSLLPPTPLAIPLSGPIFEPPIEPPVLYPIVAVPANGWDNAVAFGGAPADILDLLVEEYYRPSSNCLNTGYAGCDWTPEMFASSVQGLFQSEREDAYRACRAVTSGVFPSPLASVEAVEAYIVERRAALQAQMKGLETAPAMVPGMPAVGDRKEGGKTLGIPGVIGANYKYDFGWKVAVTEKSPSGDICRVGTEAWATFDAGAWYPNTNPSAADIASGNFPVKTVELLHMEHRAGVGAASAMFKSEMRILGNDVYTPFNEAVVAGYEKRSSPPAASPPVAEGNQTFVVVVVPFTVGYRVNIDPGVDWWLKVSEAGACNTNVSLGIDAGVTPYVSAKLGVYVMAGVPGFGGVGVDGQVELLKVSVPVHAKVRTQAEGSGASAKLFLSLDHEAKVKLDELSGRLSGFAELCLPTYPFPICKRFEKEIFAWDGLHQELPLWHHQNKFEVLAFNSR